MRISIRPDVAVRTGEELCLVESDGNNERKTRDRV